MTPLRLALLQGPSAHQRGTDAAVADLETAIARAGASGTQLLLTPELFLGGYDLGEAPRRNAEPADGPAARRLARHAARHGVAVAYGYAERGGDGEVYNSAQLIGADGGRLANYRKTHLYGDAERAAFRPGDELVVQATVGGLRLGLLICYDVEFPEAVRAHALAGTDVLLVPTALMRPYDAVARTLVPARALENQLYIAYANHSGHSGDLTFTGLSALAAPDGSTPARAGGDATTLTGEVDPAVLRASRAANPYLADRRPQLYRHSG